MDRLRIIDDEGNTLFSAPGISYEIPIYQRAFAWGTELDNDVNRIDEVCQLMDDIQCFNGETYYIGSMVVRKKNEGNGTVYEVIDGQQRLTALFIILSCLNWQFNNLKIDRILKYSNRKNSQRAIDKLDNVISRLKTGSGNISIEEPTDSEKGECWQTESGESLESSICDAVRRVFKQFDHMGPDYQKQLLEGLRKVVLYRIEVPDGTDLNLYFEIMNVRGEQLEQSDIVKARLMRVLNNDEQREWFAKIWNACYDMTGYVQMNFSNKDGDRDFLFGSNWSELPTNDKFERLSANNVPEEGAGNGDNSTMLSAILNPNAGIEFGKRNEDNDPEDNSRFRSVIYFHHFLLHVLRIYKKSNHDQLERGPLNEKDVAGEFETALPENENRQSEWAWGFIIYLLRCRCLFDRYFIKRDYADDEVGEWRIMSLNKSGERSWQYSETGGKNKDNKRCLMIESCLRVTYTEHKTMHWITSVLDWVYGKHIEGHNPSISEVADKCEEFARKNAGDDLRNLKNNLYRMGTRTPHLLFNYLDYLLWKQREYSGDENVEFDFEYRNSVEHWYPQHPTTIAVWETSVQDDNGRNLLDRDGFGNLCLIHARDNSRFSNLPPIAKSRYSKEMNAHGSLKYRLMIKYVDGVIVNDANESWQTLSFVHGREMLNVLADDVNFDLGLENAQWRA